ncbi:MAG TPA: DUF6600 domain-containing protein [Saprospiraceae bacterium]|nr:DUF6600 domain-containing protein [Saprospiraceae bacterium]
MKARAKITLLFILISLGVSRNEDKLAAQAVVSFQVFYDELSPYGTWVQNPDYGYVWVPNAGPDFIPYSSQGYWTLTEYGWTWVSYYPWGWAPFHYGRWYDDPFYGPMWVPDNEWGPGWVTWRRSANYYGWAPIGPGVELGVAYSNGYNVPYNHWTYIKDRDFGRRNSYKYYVNASRKEYIYRHTQVVYNERFDKAHNTRYNSGPDRKDVEKHWGRPVKQVTVKEMDKPGQRFSKNQVQLYRPQVQKEKLGGAAPAPAKVTSLKDVKPPSQRTTQSINTRANQAAPKTKLSTNTSKPVLNNNVNKSQPVKPSLKAQKPIQNSQQRIPETKNNNKPSLNQPNNPRQTNKIPTKQSIDNRREFQQPVKTTKPSNNPVPLSKQHQEPPKMQQAKPAPRMQNQTPQPQMKSHQESPRMQQPTPAPKMQNPSQRIQQQQNMPRPPAPSRQMPTNQGNKNERK